MAGSSERPFDAKKGFTLLELSIVLVIISIIVGAIVAGQSLIRAARVRSVARDISAYLTAIQGFTQKYNGPPGDITNATSFWGAANSNPTTCAATQGTGTQTCNGNGNGLIGDVWDGTYFYEGYRAWQQLAIAGFIEGNYTGISYPDVSNPTYVSAPGVNVPQSAITNAGFTITNLTFTDDGTIGVALYPAVGRKMFEFGLQVTSNVNEAPALTSAEALAIDQKLDDGLPGKGKITTLIPNQWYDIGHCSSNSDPTVAVYQVNYNDIACMLVISLD